MTATGHALVATLIIAKIPNPYISLPLAFLSHFACDLIPHWDAGTHHRKKSRQRLFNEAALDVVVSVISSFVLYYYVLGQSNYLLLFTAIFLSQLPDWVTAPYLILRSNNSLISWSKHMYRVQHELNARLENPFWGIATQVATVALLYILLFVVL